MEGDEAFDAQELIEKFILDKSFASLRESIRVNPDSINGFIDQLQHTNLGLYEALKSHPEVVQDIVEAICSVTEQELQTGANIEGEPYEYENDEDEDEYEDVEDEPMDEERTS